MYLNKRVVRRLFLLAHLRRTRASRINRARDLESLQDAPKGERRRAEICPMQKNENNSTSEMLRASLSSGNCSARVEISFRKIPTRMIFGREGHPREDTRLRSTTAT